MAFYTALDSRELDSLLVRFDIRELASCSGASDGIENSTYFLRGVRDGRQQDFVLTLFEDLSFQELPFFILLMQWLHEHDLPVACPLVDHDGVSLHHLSGRPALLFPRLAGRHPVNVTAAHCEQIGDSLGRLHAASQQYPHPRDNPRGTAWMEEAQYRLRDLINGADDALLGEQIANARHLRTQGLPVGIIHGDLFRDNTLFDITPAGERLSGIIDFYNACSDMLLLDLAITLNDWCSNADGSLDETRCHSLLTTYQRQRPLLPVEIHHWQAVLQLAAARFWLSRLLGEKLPRHGSVHAHKPSSEYRQRLLLHKSQQVAPLK